MKIILLKYKFNILKYIIFSKYNKFYNFVIKKIYGR